MTDDELLEAAGQIARSDVAGDPRWAALALGDLSEADEAELRALAEASAEGRAAYEAFRPLDEAFRERAVDHIMALTAAGPASRRGGVARRRAWPRAVSVGALAAAALLFGFLWPRRSLHEPMPGYVLSIEGDAASRSEPALTDAVVHLGPRSRVEITLRPAADVAGPVAARCFLDQDRRVRAWETPVEVAPTGAVRIAGERERLFAGIPAGRWEVICVVGRPGAIPASAGAIEGLPRGEGGEGPAYRLLRGVISLDGDAP